MADAVGAMICATFGMSVDNFINATQEAFAVASSYSRPEPKDGERIQVPPTAVFRSVVQFDDHPSAQQRIGSLTRLKSIIAAKYNKNARIYSDLKQILDTQGAAARQANGRGPDPTTASSTPVPSPGFPNSTPGSVTPPATFNDSN